MKELLSIGRFAKLSGLTIHALRHYDDVGLLHPADVDTDTGYRRYRDEQLPVAKLVKRLRWLAMPIEDIREVVRGDEASIAGAIARHRTRLERDLALATDRLATIDTHTQMRITMPEPKSPACRPVQMKLTVADVTRAVGFYQALFGVQAEVTRRTEDEDFYGFAFGQYDQPDFFLVHLVTDPEDMDANGPATIGLLAQDLDETHRLALATGAVEAVPPMSPEGMPRCSAVRDPDGNWIWLYQA